MPVLNDIHSICVSGTSADLINHKYTEIQAISNATPTINGVSVTMPAGTSLKIKIKSIASATGCVLLGENINVNATPVDINTLRHKVIKTLPSGVDFVHSLLLVDNQLFTSTRDISNPTKFVRINDVTKNLDDLTIVSLPYKVTDMVCVGDIIYLCYGSLSNDWNLRIGAINKNTLALSMPINIPTTLTFPWQGCFCTDGTYLYVLTAYGRAEIHKFRLSDYVRVGLYTSTYYGAGHSILYDNGILYATSNEWYSTWGGQPAYNWIIKLNADTLVELDRVNYSNLTRFSDDFCKVGNYLYVPIESSDVDKANLWIVNANSLSAHTTVVVPDIGTPLSTTTNYKGTPMSYGTFYDGRYVYAIFTTEYGMVARIDPTTNKLVDFINLGNDFSDPNELVFSPDRRTFYFTNWSSPAKIGIFYDLFTS